MARVPGRVESARPGGEFENRQKTCCSEPPGFISPCFACLTEIGLIKVAAHRVIPAIAGGCVQITTRGFGPVAPREFIQAVARECVQVAVEAGKLIGTARGKRVKGARCQGKRTAQGAGWSPGRPVRPRDGKPDRGPWRP
jgi:hypothetical protein